MRRTAIAVVFGVLAIRAVTSLSVRENMVKNGVKNRDEPVINNSNLLINTHGIWVQIKLVRGEMSLVLNLLTAQEQFPTINALKHVNHLQHLFERFHKQL